MGGIGISYGDDIQQYAPNLRLYYFPNHKICFGPEFAFFPETRERDVETKLTEYGFTGHFILNVTESLGIYPLLGLNYAVETEKSFGLHEETTSFGANLGAGLHLELENYFPYLEYKYVASGLAQNVVSIGILITIRNRKHESE